MSVIVDKAQPIIDYLIQFKKQVKEDGKNNFDKEKTYKELFSMLNSFKTELEDLSKEDLKFNVINKHKNEITKDIHHLLAMLCDDIIVQSDKIDGWQIKTLDSDKEFKFENINNRSVEVFNIYNRIGVDKIDDIQEIFYVCFSLGLLAGDERVVEKLSDTKKKVIASLERSIDKPYKITPTADVIPKSDIVFHSTLSSRIYKVICGGLMILVIIICWWLRHDVTYLIEETANEIKKQQLQSPYDQQQ